MFYTQIYFPKFFNGKFLFEFYKKIYIYFHSKNKFLIE